MAGAGRSSGNINNKLLVGERPGLSDSYDGTRLDQQTQVYAWFTDCRQKSKSGHDDLILKRAKRARSHSLLGVNAMFSAGNNQWRWITCARTGEPNQTASFNGAWHEGWTCPGDQTSHAWSSAHRLCFLKGAGLGTHRIWLENLFGQPHTGDLSGPGQPFPPWREDILLRGKIRREPFTLRLLF